MNEAQVNVLLTRLNQCVFNRATFTLKAGSSKTYDLNQDRPFELSESASGLKIRFVQPKENKPDTFFIDFNRIFSMDVEEKHIKVILTLPAENKAVGGFAVVELESKEA